MGTGYNANIRDLKRILPVSLIDVKIGGRKSLFVDHDFNDKQQANKCQEADQDP